MTTTKTCTASGLNAYQSFKSLSFIHFGRCSLPSSMRITFLNLFYPCVFLFSLENVPITLNCFLPVPFFFFLLIGKMSLSSIFRLMTSPLSIKLNDFYCLWGLQPHSFSLFHQFSSFLIPLTFLFCPQTISSLPSALHQFF